MAQNKNATIQWYFKSIIANAFCNNENCTKQLHKNIINAALMMALFLIPGVCFALDSATIYNPNDFLKSSDVSLQLLSKIFGMIPGISQFTSSGKTIVSTLFYAFNWGLFGCSGLFLCYTTIKVIAETSLEGGQMKGNVTAMWTVLRIICGVGLLIPNSSGYSTVNTLVMWVVLQSISLANWTWYNVCVGFGNNIGISSVAVYGGKGAGAKEANKAIDDLIEDKEKKPIPVGTVDVLRSLVCAEAVKLALNNIPKKQNIGASLTSKFQVYKCDESKGCILPYLQTSGINVDKYALFDLLFPGYSIAEDKKASIAGPINDNFKASQLNGICGSFKVSVDESSEDKDKDYADSIAHLQQMISSLDEEAKRLLGVVTSTKKGAVDDSINPLTYPIAIERGEPVPMATADPNPALAPRESKYIKDHSSNKDKIFADDPAVSNIKDKLLSLKIPQTSQELLSAATFYYQANTFIRTAEKIKEAAKTEEAKKEQLDRGWAVAGSYYRFIETQIKQQANTQQAATIEDARAKPGERSSYPSNSLFKVEKDTGGSDNVAYLFKSIDASALGSLLKQKESGDSYDNFSRIMTWLYFVPAYAQILKTNLAAGISATDFANSEKLNTATSSLQERSEEFFGNPGYGALQAQQGAAIAILCIPVVGPSAIAILVGLPTRFMNYRLEMIMKEWNKVMSKNVTSLVTLNGKTIPSSDPITKLQLLGHAMVEHALGYFDDMKTLSVGIGVAYGVSSIVTTTASLLAGVGSFMGMTTGTVLSLGTSGAINSTLESMTRSLINGDMAMGIAVFLPVLLTGLTLAIYIPLIPYMLFLFGVISWLISVVCLMFAAPIICFLMLWSGADQENPLLSREAGQFVGQLLAAFVRPALMIAGLVVGMILATVSINLLNYGFDAILINSIKTLKVSDIATKDFFKNIESLGGVIVYTFIMISVVNMCFSTIHLLYTEVMRIVGIQVGQGGGEAEKAMQDVKQSSESFAQAAGGGVKEGAGTGKDMKSQAHMESGDEKKKRKEDAATHKKEKTEQGKSQIETE